MPREYDYLVELSGDNCCVKELGESLIALGIKGSRGNFIDCPLSNALVAKFGGAYAVNGTYYGVGRLIQGKVPTSCELPQAAKDFVMYFDRGDIPELIR